MGLSSKNEYVYNHALETQTPLESGSCSFLFWNAYGLRIKNCMNNLENAKLDAIELVIGGLGRH